MDITQANQPEPSDDILASEMRGSSLPRPPATVASNLDPEERLKEIHEKTAAALIAGGVSADDLEKGHVRIHSVLYMVYWSERLRNNPEESARVREHLEEYLGPSVQEASQLVDALLSNGELTESARSYVTNLLQPVKTVDLVLVKEGSDLARDREVLCLNRGFYPLGTALPGGIVKESDESNSLGLPAHLYAALRVAGEKVLGAGSDVRYSRETEAGGRDRFVVRGSGDTPAVIVYAEDGGGYHFRENIRSILRPADPRHIVDTHAFRCELVGEPKEGLSWRRRADIMSPSAHAGGFAFEHHREIVSHIAAQTSVEKEREMKDRTFVRSIIADPLGSYRGLQAHFLAHGNSPNAPFKELFPVVDRLIAMSFSEDVNKVCEEVPVLAGVRDKAIISLRQVCLKNRTFCPYLPTMRAIAEGIAFFDLVAREKRDFYDTMPKDHIVEHNPRTTPNASYHMYRYKYRLDELMGMLPNEIVIPTFEPLSATDLMRVRGVPIRFVGLSTDFLYVDEFEQSPEEFFMHDCNHTWRMIAEDRDPEAKYGLTPIELLEQSNAFIKEYLDSIKILPSDTEEARELKKLKKIILFEIVHEDARPFLKDVVCKYVQLKEGGSVPFEVPRIDPRTGYMDIVDTLDTGISTLSYVRNKLQHGFYDHVDAQMPQIVSPKYRTSEWIARAAYDMLSELNAEPAPDAELDVNGKVSYEWLLRRTCSVGPDNIHEAASVDPMVERFGDGAERLNPKRYQSGGM